MRYARQTVLADLGEEGQAAFAKARVLIVGTGGLGSPLALYLAAAGIGHLGLVDADRVGLSNLQRQILFQTKDIDRLKVDVAKERVTALNPEVAVEIFPEFIDSANALGIANGYDILVDASDNFETKYLLNDLAVKLDKPLVYGSILRFQGQASVFWASEGPCYRCLFPQMSTEAIPNCAEAGVLGAVAGVIGSIEALEVMKVILKLNQLLPAHHQLLTGRLLSFDAQTMQQSIVRVPKDPDCPVCSLPRDRIVLPSLDLSCAIAAPEDFVKNAEQYQFIDVREDAEWERGHIKGALHWPLSRLKEGLMPEMSGKSVLYCQSGMRSRLALNILKENGISAGGHLPEGFATWAGAVAQGK
jgi:molybdopterin/thiamine biosynthesis adenylyltransferase/rhodanese-related sulfurtransferase